MTDCTTDNHSMSVSAIKE